MEGSGAGLPAGTRRRPKSALKQPRATSLREVASLDIKMTPADVVPDADRLNDLIDSVLYYGILGTGVLSVVAGFVYYLYSKVL